MSDYERVKALLDELGIGYREETYDTLVVGPRNDQAELPGARCLVSEQGDAKVSGYGGFLTQWTFTSDGAFVEMGAWE